MSPRRFERLHARVMARLEKYKQTTADGYIPLPCEIVDEELYSSRYPLRITDQERERLVMALSDALPTVAT